MAIISGEQNRAAGRDFNENHVQIDQLDTGHTINIAIPAEKENERPLVKAQRRELNKLVETVAAADGSEAFIIWQKVHAEIGVTSIDDMTVNQYQTANSFLQAMFDRCKEKEARKALVALLLRSTGDNESRQKLINYCHINFGTGRLNDLTRPQLQIVLSWLNQNSHNDDHPITAITSQLNIADLFRTYPKESGFIFIIGAVIGALIF